MILKILLLVTGVFCCSTAVLFIKHCHMHPLWLSAARLMIAAIVLLPFWWRAYRSQSGSNRPIMQSSLLPGIFLAAHFITWIYGARMTPAAHSTLIVNLVPMVSPFFLFFAIRERVSGREIIGTVSALIGIIVLVGKDLGLSSANFQGDLLCFISMLLLCVYLVLGRKNKNAASIWLYLVPLYAIAALLCLAAALLVNPVLPKVDLEEGVTILALGIIPTVIGHSLLNSSMRHWRGQVVTTANSGQCLFAGIMAFFLFGEIPHPAFYVAAAGVFAGIIITLYKPGLSASQPSSMAGRSPGISAAE